MFPYVEERFSDDEVGILQRYFTNVDGPVSPWSTSPRS